MHNNWLSFTIPTNLRCELDKNVKNVNVPFKAIKYNDLHMTLIFFGKLMKNKSQYGLIMSVLEAVESNTPFKFKFKHYSYFPYEKKNHIVAIYETNDECQQYVKTIKNKLRQIGIIDPYENFIPHITLGKLSGKLHNNNDILSHLTPLPDFEASTAYICGQLLWYMDTQEICL